MNTLRWFRRGLTILLLIGVCLYVALVLLALISDRTGPHHRISDQNNLKQLGLVLKMYANESPDYLYPPITPYEGVWMMDLERIYPVFLSDPTVLVSPDLPNADWVREEIQKCVNQQPIDWERFTRLAARSYTYTGWVVEDMHDVASLNQVRQSSSVSDEFVEVDGVRVWRPCDCKREGLLVSLDTRSGNFPLLTTAIMFNSTELVHSRKSRLGSNVLYLDGHVEFIHLNERFPIQDNVLDALK